MERLYKMMCPNRYGGCYITNLSLGLSLLRNPLSLGLNFIQPQSLVPAPCFLFPYLFPQMQVFCPVVR
ncbi:hypothetical protein [Coleofasciculus sp. G2-EDA-02]|uniref:hypothetical protein n=1 Tax=Coleofasciculus sp. G2-EDA-02 TaxID=3069529 RepID=UPI0033046641